MNSNYFSPNFIRYIAGGEKSNLSRDSNPGPLAYRASTLTTEPLRPLLWL